MKTLCSIEQNSIVLGSIEILRKQVLSGSDIILHIEHDDFQESLIFNNMMVFQSECLGFTIPHLAHGNLSPLLRIYNEKLSSTIYIYDSSIKNVVMHNMASDNTSSTVVHNKNNDYLKYVWLESRAYKKIRNFDISFINSLGSDFKVRVDFGSDVVLILKPDIVYFNNQDEFVIKSSQILLPTSFVKNIKLYTEVADGFTDSDEYGISFISIQSSGKAIIYHILNSVADEIIDSSVKKGKLDHSLGNKELVKEYNVGIEILVPK